jgi:hypothetical protein
MEGRVDSFNIEGLIRLDPREFENLVKTLLIKMGFKAATTKASGDGGVDIIATNEQPILGGKYVIQCKRYSIGNNIGEPVIRELYGAMMHENASKGILITTSDFTRQAAIFAQNKAVELINGSSVLCLLNKYLVPNAEPESPSLLNSIGRFTASNLVIIDEETGLVWARDANLADKVTWNAAVEFVEKLNRQRYAGYKEWRLPEISEFTELLDFADRQRENDGITKFLKNTMGFRNIISGYLDSYWSSSTSEACDSYAWVIIMGDGPVCGDKYESNKHLFGRYVWPVCDSR